MNDITEDQDDDNEYDLKIPSFEVAKQQRSDLIAELRQGEAGARRLAELLAKCHKGNQCNLHECPVCQRRKQLPKFRIPASIIKSWLGTLAPREIYLSKIQIVGERRPLREEKLCAIVASIDQIGLQTPITVRRQKKKVILVCGRYRLAAWRSPIGRAHSLGGQQDDHAVTERMSGAVGKDKEIVDVARREHFCLLASHREP